MFPYNIFLLEKEKNVKSLIYCYKWKKNAILNKDFQNIHPHTCPLAVSILI